MFTPVGLTQPRHLKARLQRVCQVVSVCAVLILLATTGCSSRYDDMPAFWPVPTRDYDNYGPGRFKTALLAAQIDRHYRGSAPGPIGVTTFVNIDDLYASSTFGRMVGEQLMSELSMKGFDVIELRHADALQFLDRGGEFALSRDAGMVKPEKNLAGVVVGTYVTSPERVYVNARLIDPSTSKVLSAGSVEMSKTAEIAKLIRGGSIPASLERIPVRHLGQEPRRYDPNSDARKRWSQEESDWNPGSPLSNMPNSPAPSLPAGVQIPSDKSPLSVPSAPVKPPGSEPVIKVE